MACKNGRVALAACQPVGLSSVVGSLVDLRRIHHLFFDGQGQQLVVLPAAGAPEAVWDDRPSRLPRGRSQHGVTIPNLPSGPRRVNGRGESGKPKAESGKPRGGGAGDWVLQPAAVRGGGCFSV